MIQYAVQQQETPLTPDPIHAACLLLIGIVWLIPVVWSLRGPLNRINYRRGSQSVLRGSQRILDQRPENPWMYFCNGYFEVYLFFKFAKNNRETSLITDTFISYDC
jgi:hypothetical protein